MAWFKWQGLDAETGPQHGLLKARSQHAAALALSEQKIRVTVLKPMGTQYRQPNNSQFLCKFLYQWHSLLSAGFDHRQAWMHLHQQSKTQVQADASAGVVRALNEGLSIAKAMGQYPQLFPDSICAWVKIGEETGRLGDVLTRLVNNLTAEQSRRQQMRAALRYPLIVLAVAGLTVLLMVFFLLPKFAAIYAQLEVPLPPLTALLLQLNSSALQQQLVLGFVAAALLLLFIRHQASKAMLRYRGASRIYAMPLLGQWWSNQHVLHDLDMLVLTLASGIPLQQGCALIARFSASGYWQHHWRMASKHLSQGITLAQTLSRTMLPTVLLEAIATGEHSGQLVQQLQFAMRQLTEQLNEQQQGISQLLPTLVLIAVSIIVLLLLLALYLPLFQLGQTVR